MSSLCDARAQSLFAIFALKRGSFMDVTDVVGQQGLEIEALGTLVTGKRDGFFRCLSSHLYLSIPEREKQNAS